MRYVSMGELVLLNGGEPTSSDWKTFVLDEPMMVTEYHVVPRGFCTDFASIPWFARWAFRSTGAPWQRAAVYHDWLYSSVPGTRKQADRAYYWQARKDGTSELRAMAMYVALRLGAGMAWRKNRERYEADPDWRMLGEGEAGSPLWPGVSD